MAWTLLEGRAAGGDARVVPQLLLLAALLVAFPAGALNIDWVAIGDPGNAPDAALHCEPVGVGSPDCGSVA